MASAKVLGEALGALQCGGRGTGPKSRDAGCLEALDQTTDQRRFRADHNELDALGAT